MEAEVVFKGVNQGIQRSLIAFEINNTDLTYLNATTGETLDLKLVKHREKRSTQANALYQKVSSQVADLMGISSTEYHNRVLAELGIVWKDGNGKPECILHLDNDWWLKCLKSENHYAPMDMTEERKGKVYRWFIRLKPSREFNTKEMSALIDYVFQDAESLGIQVDREEIKRIDWQE